MNYNESMFKNVLIVVVAISLLISSYYWSSDTDLADVAKKTNNINYRNLRIFYDQKIN